MFKEERHQYILKQLKQKKRVTSNELSQALGVSDDTIRRDLNDLAQQNKIKKVHGGALPVKFSIDNV